MLNQNVTAGGTAQKVEKVGVVKNTEKDTEMKVVEQQSVANALEKKATEIELLKKQLEEQLNKIAHKNEIANNREVFLEKKKALLNTERHLKKEDTFEARDIKISFTYPSQNSRYEGESFSISNRSLILKFIGHLIFEIDTKVKEIENELIND